MKFIAKGKQYFIALILLMLSVYSAAQPLKTGDTLPEMELQHTINYTGALNLQQSGKQLVILQFWNTLCKACIQSLKVIDSLQHKYTQEVRFVLVSTQTKKEIEQFFAEHRKIKQPDVVFITGDTVLKKHFPHLFVPHHVWLEQGKKVLAITPGYNTTEKTINEYLQKKRIHVKQVKTYQPFRMKLPLLHDHHADTGRAAFTFYSYLVPAIDSLMPSDSRQKKNNSKQFNRILLHKTSISGLYLVAYNEGLEEYQHKLGNLRLSLKDSVKYMPPADMNAFDEWSENNSYLYDLQVPASKAGRLYQIMQNDLQRMFGWEVTKTNEMLPCLELEQLHPTGKLCSKGGTSKISYRKPPRDSLWCFDNMPYATFSSRLEGLLRDKGYLFKDSSGYDGNIDICLPSDIFDTNDIITFNSYLKPYNLVMKQSRCETNVLTISN